MENEGNYKIIMAQSGYRLCVLTLSLSSRELQLGGLARNEEQQMIIFYYFNKEYCPIMPLWTNNLHFSATFVKVPDKLILHYRTFQSN